MTFKPRFQHQLRKVAELFELASEQFSQQKPVDRWLSDYFRKHSQFGSKDRKLISNTIFGYYRWYGWLKLVPKEEILKALLLGYRLDGNPVSEMTEYWSSETGVDQVELSSLGDLSIGETSQLLGNFSKALVGITPEQLNPAEAQPLTDQLVKSYQTRPKLWVRLVNGHSRAFTAKLEKNGIGFSSHPKFDHSLALEANINLYEYESFRKGYLEVQDISSQGIGYLCDPKEGEIWWDACAGSGGKALQLAALMKGQGRVYATEIYPTRLKEMRKRIKRNSDWSIIEPMVWDGIINPSFDTAPDHILVDAPCSCSGTWRRSPDLRWHPQQEKIQQYRQLQLNILNLVQEVVPKGGKLVYATCSIYDEENLGVVKEFLSTHSDFRLIPTKCPFTEKSFETGVSFKPPQVDGNSMFVAILKKSP